MTTTPLRPQPVRAAMPAATDPALAHLFTGLELFWPSRRGHAFDEFCR